MGWSPRSSGWKKKVGRTGRPHSALAGKPNFSQINQANRSNGHENEQTRKGQTSNKIRPILAPILAKFYLSAVTDQIMLSQYLSERICKYI